MPLSKSNGNMYTWVTHTHTHIAGECPHRCVYCYVPAMARRFGHERYKGELRLVEDELRVRYGQGRTIFVEHCNDLWADGVPDVWIEAILAHCREWPMNTYVFQSKNPERMRGWLSRMPYNRLLGCTIESTDFAVTSQVSNAPAPWDRRNAMIQLRNEGERVFITIEPILNGDMLQLAQWCALIKPEFVNIGADSKGIGLSEPTAEAVGYLLNGLRRCGVEIRAKHNLGRLLSNGPRDDLPLI